ncbi:MAG: preprotein translocase subunit Sec61beta [Candidatus ainarchaeum sp.]|nr:preprotein translocase subunit Sec61beta [Candidatus ainarchaeum sp.]MDD3975616.1 preprotein translocase subunit Sec61beta [Candidatus ainarchaeum sp.]
MKLKQTKSNSQGPSSAIGIMKFNDSAAGPKISPEAVIIISIVFVVFILILKSFL